MRFLLRNLAVASAVAASLWGAAAALGAETSAAKPIEKKGQPAPSAKAAPAADPAGDKAAEKPVPPKRKLSATMSALRDRVRQTLTQHFRQPINTADNTSAEVLDFCLAYGCDAEIRYGGSAGNPISGIGCLCFGYPCGGFQLLAPGENGKLMPRLGYGLQERPGELLAVLAQSAVPASYEIRVGERRGTVADLAEFEKLTCRSGGDLSQKLIGLAFYVNNGDTWKNQRGESWSVERLLQEELARTVSSSDCEITHHLMALSFAMGRRARGGQPSDGHYRRAEKYAAEFQQYAFDGQNSDGSWHPNFFASRGAVRDPSGSLRSTGHILEWLAFSLPDDKLEDARVVKSVAYVSGLLSESYGRWNVAATTPREIESVTHALHALRLYDRRVFKPYDPPEEEAPAASPGKPGPRTTPTSAKK